MVELIIMHRQTKRRELVQPFSMIFDINFYIHTYHYELLEYIEKI